MKGTDTEGVTTAVPALATEETGTEKETTDTVGTETTVIDVVDMDMMADMMTDGVEKNKIARRQNAWSFRAFCPTSTRNRSKFIQNSNNNNQVATPTRSQLTWCVHV
jgi:hypothetical protein